MTCAHCVDAADFFGSRMAGHELKRYRKKGPSSTTRLLVEGVRREVDREEGWETGGPRSTTLLDIGGGVGAVQHELLAAGAGAVTAVDAAPAYLAAAREEAERRGTADRVTYLQGDAVELADRLPLADVVTLDRVLCCYPDMPALVEVSARRAGRVWGIVVPRESWWVRVGVGAINLFQRLRRKAFRVHLHGLSRIREEAERHGLERVSDRRTFLWHVQLFRRSGGD